MVASRGGRLIRLSNHSARRGLVARVLGEHPVGTAFVTPYVVFLAAVFAYPLGFAVYMSFHDYFFAAPGAIVDRPFVGFDNYATVLADPAVRRAFANVGVFLLINVPLTVVLSLVLAAALNTAIRWRAFFRVSYYVPYVTASVAVVGVWLFLFNSDGLVNQLLRGRRVSGNQRAYIRKWQRDDPSPGEWAAQGAHWQLAQQCAIASTYLQSGDGEAID